MFFQPQKIKTHRYENRLFVVICFSSLSKDQGFFYVKNLGQTLLTDDGDNGGDGDDGGDVILNSD